MDIPLQTCEDCPEVGYRRGYLDGIILCFYCYIIRLELRKEEYDEEN